LEKYLGRIGWLGGEQVLRILAGLFFVTIAARYLGPAGFGALTYVVTVAALASQVVRYGQDNLIIKNVVTRQDETSSAVATAFLIRLALAVIASAAAVTFLLIVSPPAEIGPVMLAGACMIILAVPLESHFAASKAFELFRQLAIGRSIVVVGAAAATLALVVFRFGVEAFVILRGAEALLYGAVSLIIFMLLVKPRGRVQLRPAMFARMVRAGFPMMLSQLAVLAYLTIDQIMLGLMAGSEELGLYGVAVRIAMLGAFLPQLLQTTTYPTLVRRQSDGGGVEDVLPRYFDYFGAAGWLLTIGTGLGAGLFLVPLFGPDYASALPVCLVLLLSLPLFALTTAYKACLSARGDLWSMTMISGAAACTNVILNLALIPAFGGMGAAIATIAALLVASIVSAALRRSDRPLARMMLRSLEPAGTVSRTARQVWPIVMTRLGRAAP